MMRSVVRAVLWEAMAAEVEELGGAVYHPDPESPYQRAGSEKGVKSVGYLSSSIEPGRLFEQVVEAVGQGLPLLGVGRARNAAVSKGAAGGMWAEKSREHLKDLRALLG